MLVSYNWLKEYVGDALPEPEKVTELLTFHSFEIEGVDEVGDDFVIDIDVLPNRGSDCLSHRGIARELATILDTALVTDPLSGTPELAKTDAVEVTIENEEDCRRFTAAVITGVTVKESPDWLKDRLRTIGQRPINNIVDATNYVMFATGQPLHAYDAELFPRTDGTWKFDVRKAKEGETIDLIAEGSKTGEGSGDRSVTLTGSELLIVDGSSNTPIGLAGVKGGRFAGVHEGTKNIIIEAANFEPTLTRKTARGLGIVIDASKRFENGPSQNLPLYAQREITALIADIAGGACEGMVDIGRGDVIPPAVTVRMEKVNALLGLSLTNDEVAAILTRVGCQLMPEDGGFTVTGPWERSDLTIEENFIEEIGRVYGYTHIDSVVPEAVSLAEVNVRHYYSELVRTELLKLGFSEVITSSFRKKDEISLYNALASDKGCLRSTLAKNISESLEQNIRFTDLLGVDDIRIFEIGTVFTKGEDGIAEHVSLCLGVRSKVGGATKYDEDVLTMAIGELTNTLDTNLSFTIKDGAAELNFSRLIADLPVPTEYQPVPKEAEKKYESFSTYPHVSRDIALWVAEGITADDVRLVLNENAGPLRVRTRLFDEFKKDGRVSYAFRLVFQSDEKTLTDEEINAVMEEVYGAVAKKDWEVR